MAYTQYTYTHTHISKHKTYTHTHTQKTWRNKPLFRREGDARFRTGAEAAEMLINEVKRRDSHEKEFVQVFENAMLTLAPVFERFPKYAFVAKEVSVCVFL